MTASSIMGRSAPSRDRAVVDSSTFPSSTSDRIARAVIVFEPLAIANRVSIVFAMAPARSAKP